MGRALLSLAEAGCLNGRLCFGAHSRTHLVCSASIRPSWTGRCRFPFGARGGARRSGVGFRLPLRSEEPEVERLAAAAGYLAACGIDPGRNRPSCDLFALKRLEVRGTDSLLRFAVTLWLGGRRR